MSVKDLFLVIAVAVLLAIPSISEARCFGKGRIRGWFKNHRPHILHFRSNCR